MRASVLALTVALSIAAPGVALGGVEQPFSFTQPGGNIPDDAIAFFPLTMNSPSIPEISSIELDIVGLSHDTPMDLDVYLINPFGQFIEVMTDRGDQIGIENVSLTFRDGAGGLPAGGALVSGAYEPEGLTNGTDSGLATFVGTPGGAPASWILVVADDDPTGTGSFTAWTLRGTFVPEPMTLSLLAVGALATLRRRR